MNRKQKLTLNFFYYFELLEFSALVFPGFALQRKESIYCVRMCSARLCCGIVWIAYFLLDFFYFLPFVMSDKNFYCL